MSSPPVRAHLDQMFAGQTPYTFSTRRRRPHLKNPVTGDLATDAEVLERASSPCNAWDDGQAMPANLNVLLYGSPMPANFSVNRNLTSVEALQHLYRFLVPKDLRTRVASRSTRHGGPLKITEDQANRVMKAYKEAFEETFSADWNDDGSGALQNTAFADDAGAAGTFARTLSEVTTDSLPLIAIYGGVTVLLSALFFVSMDCVASRVVLVVLGSMFAILGCFAALGLSALCGISLNVVHFWTMPFIIIGIGIDDMFMLALSSQTVESGCTPQAFAKAFANVAVPITMTSLVNAAMFAIMAFTSDIGAVYQAGYTGLMATAILYLTMLISFSALVYLDSQRRAGSRYDLLPCRKATARKEEADKPTVSKAIYTHVYRPAITSCIGRVAMVLASIGLLAAAAVGLSDLPVGLDLHDFFPAGTPAGKFAKDRNTYFPVWPVTLNWGQLDYTNPNVQLQMAYQWERVLSSKHIAGKDLETRLVWTAALAEWGMNQKDATCRSVLKENTLGLKLKSEGGFCLPHGAGSRCPVLEGLSETLFAQCIAKWKSASHQYAAIAPEILFNADGQTPKLPIRFSSASASVLFAHDLRSTSDYTSMIEETRKYVDGDSSLHSWMSGVPFDYWEQYLTVVEVALTIGGLSILAGFLISLAFIFTVLTISQRGTPLKRLCSSALGALLIAIASAASLLTVVGFCGLAKIQLSGFTAMSCVMSTGLAVEYSVHVTHRFLEAPPGTAVARVHHAMEWLFAPTAMAFLTSAVSVLMMAFSEFRFVRLYFFAPLACAVLTSYFFGAFALPCFLGCLDCVPALASTPSGEAEKGDTPAVKEIEEPNTPLSPTAV